MIKPYRKFSEYLLERYGTKIYKLPVNIPCTCPNRDGTYSSEGCIFCGDEGAGFETNSSDMSVKNQLTKNMAYIKKRYKAGGFIAYFQSFSSTYVNPVMFDAYLKEANIPGIVAIYVSTRPDCILDENIESMKKMMQKGVDIVVELGLQSINDETLKFLNRGHDVEAFTQASEKLKKNGIEVCAHVITDIPTDSVYDVEKCARYLNCMGVDQVKCHSLYILKGTKLGELYSKGIFTPLSLNDFLERTVRFLEHLSPETVVQRLIGRAPEERLLYGNFGMSWWKVQGYIEEKMLNEKRYQADAFKMI